MLARAKQFQSTLPVGGATERSAGPAAEHGISIHAPRGGSDSVKFSTFPTQVIFQSTLPVGGATKARSSSCKAGSNFNPRSPWGERLPERI